MKEGSINFIKANSPDGGFLQSEEWRKFQESVGRKTFNISSEGFWANIIEHKLPFVGKYFYIPRGPITEVRNHSPKFKADFDKIVKIAKENNAGWIRFDVNNLQILETIQKDQQIEKAPHDMQPKEIFLIDIKKPEEQLLAEMKAKTRYNIKLAMKHNVRAIRCEKHQATCDRAIDEFVRLMKITAERDRITPHSDSYYRKMFEAMPEKNLKLYLAEFQGKIIAANIVVFYGKVTTYLHGASDNDHRGVMAPHLLQWQAILDAKKAGYEEYDFGGVKSTDDSKGWVGITRFKTGFSTVIKPIEFPGSYDIVINSPRYNLYKFLQRIKTLF